MILLRLLSTGKSLVGVGQKERSYHLPEGRALPRFNAKKNPFRATTFPEHPREDVSITPSAERPESPAPQSSVKPAVAKPVGPARQEPARVAEHKAKGWLGALKSLCATSGKRISAPKAHTRELQGELRLDSIQVVRNDLAESDIEIVPRQEESPRVEQVSTVAAVQPSEANASAWERVSARIFGPNNVG